MVMTTMPMKSDLELRGIIPCTYRGVRLTSVSDIAKEFGCTVDLVHGLTKDKSILTIEELHARVNKSLDNMPWIYKKHLLPGSWYDGEAEETVKFAKQRDIEKYFKTSDRTVRNYCERDDVQTLNDLCVLLRQNEKRQEIRKRNGRIGNNTASCFPTTVDGVCYSSYNDVTDVLHISKDTVRKLLYKGYSIEDILHKSYRKEGRSVKSEFPCELHGVEYTYELFRSEFCDITDRQLQKRYAYFVTDRHYTMDEFYDALNGKFIKEKTKSQTPTKTLQSIRISYISENCFWLRDSIFFPSLKNACTRLDVPIHRVKIKEGLDIETEFINAWVTTRIKDYEGWVTEILRIEDFVFETGGVSYYRCITTGTKDLEYLSSKELMDRRIYYARVSHYDKNTNNGVYNSINEACAFYGLASSNRYFRKSNPARAMISASKRLNVFRDKDGVLIKGNRQCYKLSPLKWNDVINGKLSLSEAQANLNAIKALRKPVWVEEPIFNKYDIVRYKKRRFENKYEACRFYKLGKIVSEEGSNAVSDRICKELIERQNRKVFIRDLEFSSIGALCRELGLKNSRVRWLGTKYGIRRLSSHLITEYYSKGVIDSIDKNITETVILLEYSFTDSNTQEDYFTCKIKEEGYTRIKVLSSSSLISIKLNEYKYMG